MYLFKTAVIIILVWPFTIFATKINFDADAQKILRQHFEKYKNLEYFSGIGLSVSIPQEKIRNYYIGNVSHEAASKPISSESLFQIGSITKSYTSAILLRAEAEKKLDVTEKLSKWLTEYPKWSNITINSLLNMTNGLPNYSDAPLWNAAIFEKPTQEWTNDALIKYVYPPQDLSPPLKTGYFYSNTGYILAALIAEKAMHQPFATLMAQIIAAAKLENTFYPSTSVQQTLMPRMVRGYNYNPYDNPSLVGVDVTNFNLSWAGAAGAIISNPEDIIKWVNALFNSESILKEAQRRELTALISLKDAKPITQTNTEYSRGFGLGVVQAYNPNIGHYWFYEGETLGYRALYMYVACNQVVIASIFNSAVNMENDHAGDLMVNIYKMLISKQPSLACNAAGKSSSKNSSGP